MREGCTYVSVCCERNSRFFSLFLKEGQPYWRHSNRTRGTHKQEETIITKDFKPNASCRSAESFLYSLRPIITTLLPFKKCPTISGVIGVASNLMYYSLCPTIIALLDFKQEISGARK
jgi:hypothetical protein